MTAHRQSGEQEPWPTSSGNNTPSQSATSSYLPNAVTGFLRRFSSDTNHLESSPSPPVPAISPPSIIAPPSSAMNGVYTPPYRSASPYQPPPLTPLTLKGFDGTGGSDALMLTRTIAEEIRLLVPPRLQLAQDWRLVYNLEEDGVSLATLYKKCEQWRGLRNGFVLVVKDGEGGLFGAYLTEAPHPSPHFFGTGECFLWRAAVLTSDPSLLEISNLPPPPSADTTHLQRTTTLRGPISPTLKTSFTAPSSTPTYESIRFKAFPYSGVNDYLIFCETGFLSVGGGDGHYGLWLDDQLEKGISSPCLTFGNEGLSDEGSKFDVMGVELWTLGNDL